jgi:hypothetical protein
MKFLTILSASISFIVSQAFVSHQSGDRSLGQECDVSADVQCFVGDMFTSCADLRVSDPCGKFNMKFLFKYCNHMDDHNAIIHEDKIVIKLADEVYSKSDVNVHPTLDRNSCHSLTQNLTIDSCDGRKQVPASVKFEGRVEGFELSQEYYCFAWAYMKVRLPRSIPSPAPSSAEKVTFEPSLAVSSKPTSEPSRKPTYKSPFSEPTSNPIHSSAIPTGNPTYTAPTMFPDVSLRIECEVESDEYDESGNSNAPCTSLRVPNDEGTVACINDIKFIFSLNNYSSEKMRIQSFVSGRDGSYEELVDLSEPLILSYNDSHVLEYVLLDFNICHNQMIDIFASLTAIGMSSDSFVSKTDDYRFLVP